MNARPLQTPIRPPPAWLAAAFLLAAASGCGGDGGGSTGPKGPPGGPDATISEVEVSGLIGGSGDDQVRDLAADLSGNLYLAGGTPSDDFFVTSGALQTEHNPGTPTFGGTPNDVFLTKVGPDGDPVWSTFLGGPHHDRAYGVEVDAQGFIYLGGRAGAGFPTTAGSAQPGFQGSEDEEPYGPQDGFVCKLTPDAEEVVFCTYFGTDDRSIVRDLAVDGSGNIYIASAHRSGTYPAGIREAFTNERRGDDDAVVAKISSDGSRVLWATHVGGSGRELNTNSVRVDASGRPYFVTTTRSADAPTTPGAAFPSYGGDGDLYVGRLDPSTGELVWASYVGGSGNEATETHELAVSPQGDLYVAVATESRSAGTTAGAVQEDYAGGRSDILIARLAAADGSLVAATLLGGGGRDRSEGIAVDGEGRAYLTGFTDSDDFPTTEEAFRDEKSGSWDIVVVQLSAGLDRLLYSTYLGGGALEQGRAAALGPDAFYVGGFTRSGNWPTVGGTVTGYQGGQDGVYAKFGGG